MAAVILLAWSSSVFAFDGKASQFGFTYGFSVPDANNVGAYKLAGIKGETFIFPMLAIGGYFLNSDSSGQTNNAANNKFTYAMDGLSLAYHSTNQGGDSYLALRIGVSKVRMNPQGTDVIYSPYHYGLASGYDYYITNNISMGFEGSYIHVLPGRSTVNNVTFDQPSFNTINFMISVQLRF